MKTIRSRIFSAPLMLMIVLLAFITAGALQASPVSASSSHGKSWHIVPSPSTQATYNRLYSVAAFSASDVWAVGQAQYYPSPLEPLVEHWNGKAWSIVSAPSTGTEYSLNAITTIPGTHHLWVVGSNGLAAIWNGTSWTITPTAPVNSPTFYGIVALSASNAWAVGTYSGQTPTAALVEHWNGKTWSQVPVAYPKTSLSTYLYSITAQSANNLWAVGYIDNGSSAPLTTLVERWNGKQWKLESAPSPGATQNVLNGVSRIPGTNAVWTVGRTEDQSLIEYWNGKKWSMVSAPIIGAGSQLFGVLALSSRSAWAVGSYSDGQGNGYTLVEYWNGATWKVVSSPNPSNSSTLYALARVPDSGTLWAVGSFYGSNGTNYSEQTLTEQYK